MKSMIYIQWLRRGMLSTAAALSFAAFYPGVTSVSAQSVETPQPATDTETLQPATESTETPTPATESTQTPQPTQEAEKPKPNLGTQKPKDPKEIIAQKIQDLQASDSRWIQVNLKQQRLIAWEGDKPVYAIKISSGKKATPTIPGTFAVQTKLKTTRMRGRDYDVPNVPYTMFYDGNYAIHGAYWHRKFGTPVSRGCVNLAVNHAKWLFDWAKVGTPVVVHN